MLLHGLVEFGTYDYCLKLKQDGVIRNLVQLITSFLKCRFQRVILNGHTSGRTFFRIFFFRESGLVGSGVVIRIARFLVQVPLGAWPGSGSQPSYRAPGDLPIEIMENLVY